MKKSKKSEVKSKKEKARERARTRAKSPTTKNATVLAEARQKREAAAYERRVYEMSQRNLPAWARDDWRPLQPGEVQIDDVTTEDESAMSRPQRAVHRFRLLLDALGGYDGSDVYLGPGSRYRRGR